MPRKFESRTPENQGTYIDGADRDGYVDRPMKLVGIRYEPQAHYGPRHVITGAMLDSGELVAIALSANPTRVAMFAQVQADLDDDGADAYDPVVLYRKTRPGGGNPFWTFRTATDAELASAAEAYANVDTDPEPADDAGEPDDNPADAGEPAEPAKRGRR